MKEYNLHKYEKNFKKLFKNIKIDFSKNHLEDFLETLSSISVSNFEVPSSEDEWHNLQTDLHTKLHLCFIIFL